MSAGTLRGFAMVTMLEAEVGGRTISLWQCDTDALREEWVLSALRAGHTLSDCEVFVGGADMDKIVRSLRRNGEKLKRVTKRIIDAEGRSFDDVAWVLAGGE